ncbi:MAG: replication-relaxation family protein [Anaerolineales bacterium]|nr:replication-relaxation family protein [Anaerolineales bacterium]
MKDRAGDGKPLIDFLDRHPFCSRAYLEKVFGERTLEILFREEKGELSQVSVAGSGPRLAYSKESNAVLLDLRRLEIAREFALQVMGPEAVFAGLSPGFEADGEFLWQGKWWRLWVDIGGCAPEALKFIVAPPRDHGDGIRDVILTTRRGRMDHLAIQVEMKWGGGQRVHIWLVGTDEYRVARTYKRSSLTNKWKPYQANDLKAHIRVRRRGEIRRNQLGEFAAKLDEGDWATLVEVGNNPLLSTYELAYLFSQTKKGVEEGIWRTKRLGKQGLIEDARTEKAIHRLESRKVLSDLGLELLTHHWGTEPQYIHQFHPWPQHIVRRGRSKRTYSLSWFDRWEEHQVGVRQFVLALLYGARCVSNPIGGVEVRIVTTIGSRLLFRGSREGRKTKIRIVKPDARVEACIWKRGWLDGDRTLVKQSVLSRNLLVEVDRSTMSLARVKERIDRYGELWGSQIMDEGALVWVIDGTPWREHNILAFMREAGIDGWTVLVERLVLPEGDPWWLIHDPASVSGSGQVVRLSHGSIGGMAPWRQVWCTTEHNHMSSLLGMETWRQRELVKSPPRRGDQEWVRYRNG